MVAARGIQARQRSLLTRPPGTLFRRRRFRFARRPSGRRARRKIAGVSDLDRAAVLGALDAGYQKVTAVTTRLSEADLMRPTRCAGWAVADVLYHQLLDARRALRTFASPSDAPADRDDVSYWRGYAPGEASSAGADGAAARADEDAAHARYVRIAASAYPPGKLAWEWSETAAAACRAARACGHQAVTTQGHVLTVTSFAATLAVEAAVHYLDLTVDLPGAPAPDPASLALVRRVLSGLLGAPLPGSWDDVTAALKGTGREPLAEEDRRALGSSAATFPLFA
jgi:Mycothiol maleylpyruvate isomerase N-terminal domain